MLMRIKPAVALTAPTFPGMIDKCFANAYVARRGI